MFKGLPEVLGESSLLGLVLAGTAAFVLAPTVKNVLRGVAVGTAKGVLSLAEGGASLASGVREGWEDIVSDARSQKGMSNIDTNTMVGAGTGGALGASIGGGVAGPMGAAVGGGLGGVVGASVGSGVKSDNQPESSS